MAAPRSKKLLIIIASVLIMAGAAYGTIYLLKQFAPVKMADTASETASANKTSVQKAEELFANGDHQGAKTEYQKVLESYKSQNNEAAAADIEMQLRVIEATASAEKAPENTDKKKYSSGGQTE